MKKILNIKEYNEVMENLENEIIFVRDYETYLLNGETIDEIINEYNKIEYNENSEYYLQYEIIQEYGDFFKLSECVMKHTIDLDTENLECKIIYSIEYDISIDEMKKQKILLGWD